VNRVEGIAVNMHEVPTKFEPDTVTGVPTRPESGESVNVGVARLNHALPASPLAPVTMTK
jgi:hypothetical protein